MEKWRLFTDPHFDLRFNYPDPTPQGHAVDKVEGQRDNVLRVNLTSQGSRELYFELMKFPDLPPREEYRRHKSSLERQFADLDFTITELQETRLAERPAWTYTFTWRDGERVVVLVGV